MANPHAKPPLVQQPLDKWWLQLNSTMQEAARLRRVSWPTNESPQGIITLDYLKLSGKFGTGQRVETMITYKFRRLDKGGKLYVSSCLSVRNLTFEDRKAEDWTCEYFGQYGDENMTAKQAFTPELSVFLQQCIDMVPVPRARKLNGRLPLTT